jgi:hypothetical protein
MPARSTKACENLASFCRTGMRNWVGRFAEVPASARWRDGWRPGLLTVLAALMLLAGRVAGGKAGQEKSAPASSVFLLIQGRIVAMHGAVLSVKTPDDYPGTGPDVHAQVVVRGPVYEVDISGARLLLPDGRRTDTLPLALGERVVMILNDAGAVQPPRPGVRQAYRAAVVERLAASDKITGH